MSFYKSKHFPPQLIRPNKRTNFVHWQKSLYTSKTKIEENHDEQDATDLKPTFDTETLKIITVVAAIFLLPAFFVLFYLSHTAINH